MTELASEPVRPIAETVAPVVSPADRSPEVSRSTALRVGAADDCFEREADDLADTIVSALRRDPGLGSAAVADSSSRVQRTSGSPRSAGDGDAFFKKDKQADLPAVRATIAAYSAAIPRLLAEKKQRAQQLAEQTPQDVAS